ncbi:MAG: hypothetical protein U9R60_10675, partial [Bacteroidota bacterium]|nr:hypothetical protein [Bacteroidota bacterium]
MARKTPEIKQTSMDAMAMAPYVSYKNLCSNLFKKLNINAFIPNYKLTITRSLLLSIRKDSFSKA